MKKLPEPLPDVTINSAGVAVKWKGETLLIEPRDLRDGGWAPEGECERDHCDAGNCPPCDCRYCSGDVDFEHLDAVTEVLKRWHDEESGHAGPFQFCDHEPCKTAGRYLSVRHA